MDSFLHFLFKTTFKEKSFFTDVFKAELQIDIKKKS